MAQLERVMVNPAEIAAPLGAYSQAARVKTGELVFIAGQVGVNAAGELVGPGDVGAQARQTFENIGAVLASMGGSFSNIVELTTFVVGRESVEPYLAARREFYPELFPESDYPPNTLLVIRGLVREEFLVEVKVIAAL